MAHKSTARNRRRHHRSCTGFGFGRASRHDTRVATTTSTQGNGAARFFLSLSAFSATVGLPRLYRRTTQGNGPRIAAPEDETLPRRAARISASGEEDPLNRPRSCGRLLKKIISAHETMQMGPNRQRAGRRARGRDLVEMGQVRGIWPNRGFSVFFFSFLFLFYYFFLYSKFKFPVQFNFHSKIQILLTA